MSNDPKFDLDVVMALITSIINEYDDISAQVLLVSKTHAKSSVRLSPLWSNQNPLDDEGGFSHSMPLEAHNEKDHARHVLICLLITNKFISKMLLHFHEQLGSDGKIPSGTEFSSEGLELDCPF